MQTVCNEWNETILSTSSSLWYDHMVNEFQTFHYPTQQSYKDSCITLCQLMYKERVRFGGAELAEDAMDIRMHLKGDSATGKTSICNNLKQNPYSQTHDPTQAFALRKYKTIIGDNHYNISVFDHGGDSSTARSIVSGNLYTGRTGVILVFDVINKESLTNARKWYDSIRIDEQSGIGNKSSRPVPMVLVANKYDHVTKSRKIVQRDIREKLFANEENVMKRLKVKQEENAQNTETLREACEFAMEKNIPFMCISVLENSNVVLPFLELLGTLAKEIVE